MDDSGAHDEHRAYARAAVVAQGRLHACGPWSECAIVNVSAGGAKLTTGCLPGQGECVQLEIGNLGCYEGVVAWQHAGQVGLKFSGDPDKMAEVVMALAMYG